MTAVPCAECNWPVAPTAHGCGRCGAPIRDAIPPKPPEEPPPSSYRGLVVTSVPVLSLTTAIVASSNAGKGVGAMRLDSGWPSASMVPETRSLVRETIRLATCRHDWRACADNRDWAGNGDWSGPRSACLSLAEGASRLGHFGWDRSHGGPRFDSYVGGASIRRGYIVLADHGALMRDAAGGWARTTLHCTFDFVAWEVRSLAPA